MKVLLFYSKTGSGHLRAAEALKEELESQRKGIRVVLAEGLEDARFGIKTNPSFAYALFSSHLQGFYNFIYNITNNKQGVKLLRLFIKGVWGENFRKIIEKEKPDLIISTHHHISPSTIRDSKISFVTIVTDLGYPHIIWYDEKVSRIITPTKEIAEFANRITNKQNAIKIDYPLKNHFSAKEKAGFTNTILLAGGGSGSGNILKQVKILLKKLPEKKITVVCGNNKKLFYKLSKIKDERLKINGYVDHLIELYNGVDIVVTKAGPGTIVEASTLKKPLIITSWIGMQEKDNVDFVVENNLGIYEPDIRKLPGAVNKIYENYEQYLSSEPIFKDGAKKIVEYILKEFA